MALTTFVRQSYRDSYLHDKLQMPGALVLACFRQTVKAKPRSVKKRRKGEEEKNAGNHQDAESPVFCGLCD
jgi:hypothetical protein